MSLSPPLARPGELTGSLDDPALYANRELSWLDFNDRVLWEARDERNPLMERIRFTAIAASNLDEFISKRIGWLRLKLQQDPGHRTVDGMTVAEQLVAVRSRVHDMQHEIDHTWSQSLEPRLAERGFRIARFANLDDDAQAQLRDYFLDSIFPVLTPLIVDPSHPFPFISGESLSLLLNVQAGEQRRHFGRVKIPANRRRFIEAGDGAMVRLEDLIESHLQLLFPGTEIEDACLMRLLRSSEVGTPEEDAADLLELMEDTLARRRMADAVSIEINGHLPETREALLLEELGLTRAEVYTSDVMLGLADLAQIAALPVPDESFPPFTPAIPSPFTPREDEDEVRVFQSIRDADALVHHPYESFDQTVARLIQRAAEDPQVLAIKHTTYRTSPDSRILASLAEAASEGKQVAVLVELAARFDEQNNIEWARRLEDAGVHVAYGNPLEKIHAKITLIVREEATGVAMYSHIGTGNYNSRTARIYTDLGLFTANARIGGDLLRVFNHLTGLAVNLQTDELLVAPFTLRSGLEARVRREIEHAAAGRPARLIFKMNAIEDAEFTRLLYEASGAGVQVDLVVRGICRIRPGIEGISEHVRVVSVIGQFLEHSRVFYFANAGDPEVYIGSADIMKRNLDERTEVLTPLNEPAFKAQMLQVLELMLADDRQGWELHDLSWSRDQTVTEPGVHARLIETAPFS